MLNSLLNSNESRGEGTLKRHTKLAHLSLRAVAPAFRVIAAFRAARALEEEAIPSKKRFQENESV